MKHITIVNVPATKREVVNKVTCDLCGEEIKKNYYGEINEIVVKHKIGDSYPDGGSGTEASVDLCGKCFDNKLLTWLVSQGAKITFSEWDY